MAENQAEDEEDEIFGDFKFISSPYSNQNNNKEDDEDWSDFVTTPSHFQKQDFFHSSLPFQPSNSFSSVTQNPSNDTFMFSNNFDPLNIASDHTTKPNGIELQISESGKKLESRWEKPRGALPLSLFGGDEVEESDAVNDVQDIFSSKSESTPKNGSSIGSGIGFNELIVNLYGNQAENGSNLNHVDGLNGRSEVIKVENRSNSNLFESMYPKTEQIKVENGLNSNSVEDNGDFDEDDWEFKDAVIENVAGDSDFRVKKDENDLVSWDFQSEAPPVATLTMTTTSSPTKASASNIQESPEGSAFGFSSSVHDDDWFVSSNGNSSNPIIIENGFDFESGANTWKSNSFNHPKHIPTENGNNAYLVDENFDSDESFFDFQDPLTKSEALDCSPKQKEELKIVDQSGTGINELSVSDEVQENGKASDNDRKALPLSIFGDGNLDSDESSFGEDVFSFKPTTFVRNGLNSQVSSSKLSLNELISDLYGSSENIPADSSTREHTEIGFSSARTVVDSNLPDVEDDFDDSSWEFKAAFSENKSEYSSPAAVLGNIHQELPAGSKITSFVEFYTRLKEESGSIILYHLKNLKNDQKAAALSGDDTTAEALHEEIETAYKKLFQENMVSEEVYSQEHPQRNYSLKELLASMEDAKFQVLASEYRLPERLSLAEQNMKSSIVLFEHAISVVKIMNERSGEDLFAYAMAWSRMITTCIQELKHGASIWKQSIETNVDKQILSKSQGQQHILSLAEIYRVAEVLRVSATCYKPWILSSLADPIDMFTSLKDCNAVWSNSGMNDALQSLSDIVGTGYDGRAKALLESIKSIHDLIPRDVLTLQNNVSLSEPICRLSLLPLTVVPEINMVLWNGEHYFVTLANFWANLISPDPPKLPYIPVNS
ncbi:hypothetical protein FRX31_021816 [Thalictrum thalictroides]|uniref:Synergin gamma C-terminal domain-containing protein n=1 Tax=Thalictrum thalictroides TaxID=46969 RepID=A0A7J6VV56_THATH|nr:hypothetical protein FRX31_021816 [Thalictrum thalictroides]